MFENNNEIPKWIAEKLHLLTEKELLYFRMMWPKYGVLFITAKPGVAKSAISKSIADKLGFEYHDIRLSMVDETDVGLYPSVSDIENDGSLIKCLDFVVPRWAIEANKKPTIIHFEELNRASQQVRNAALQILLERQIGIDFKFNDNVLMISSGNLGDEDNTDVEEFDAALNGRLIHYKHTLTPQEWIKDFAEKNVHPLIVSYIEAYPQELYKTVEGHAANASPRTWTFLSKFIVSNFGKDSNARDFLPLLSKVASSYIGNSAVGFVRYCEDMMNINILDIINDFDRVESDLKKYKRDKKSELIQSLKKFELNDMTDNQLTNINKFLKMIGDDELTAFLLYILDNKLDPSQAKIKKFLLEHEEVLRKIKTINKKPKK